MSCAVFIVLFRLLIVTTSQQITIFSAFFNRRKQINRFAIFVNQQFFQLCQIHRAYANSFISKVVVPHNRDRLGPLCSPLVIPHAAPRCLHGIWTHDAVFCISTREILNLCNTNKSHCFKFFVANTYKAYIRKKDWFPRSKKQRSFFSL